MLILDCSVRGEMVVRSRACRDTGLAVCRGNSSQTPGQHGITAFILVPGVFESTSV